METKRFYNVTFKIGDFWHSNLAYSSSESAVKEHYSKKYAECYISDASAGEIIDARRKGKPIIEL
jgi:hypothetical protein